MPTFGILSLPIYRLQIKLPAIGGLFNELHVDAVKFANCNVKFSLDRLSSISSLLSIPTTSKKSLLSDRLSTRTLNCLTKLFLA